MRNLLALASTLALGCVVLSASAATATPAGKTTRVSVSSSGREGNDASYPDGISADGHYVVFHSAASNLVPRDTNDVADLFVRDRSAGTIRRISVSSTGAQANGQSALGAAISANGRYVAFVSGASNLVRGDTNGTIDVFVRDLATGRTTRVSVGRRGRQSNAESSGAAISANGRFVAFGSLASNLVPRDTNHTSDVFVHDRKTGRTTRVSVGGGGAQASGRTKTRNGSGVQSISADGRFVAFSSDAPNLVAGDTNKTVDLFVRDRKADRTSRVDVSSSGRQANGESEDARLSADGRYVVFQSLASSLVPGDRNESIDVFLRDRQARRTTRVSVDSSGQAGDGTSFSPWISGSGRYVAFASDARNLVAGDTNDLGDIFVRDLVTGTTRRVSLSSDEGQADGASLWGQISADGAFVSFVSSAANLVAGDTNGLPDVFVRALGETAKTFDAAKPLKVGGGTGHLLAPTDRVDVRYTVYSGSKAVRGAVYVRNDLQRRFIRLPLEGGSGLHARVPPRLLRGHKLLYYAVIRDSQSGRSAKLPVAGARAPEVAWILQKPVLVRLGTHRFGQTRAPEAVVARARADEVGWRNPPPGEGLKAGPQTFLTGRDGSVWLADGVNDRLLVRKPGSAARVIPLPLGADASDFALGPEGTLYVTRTAGIGAATHIVLDRLTASGQVLWESRLGGEYSPLAETFVLGDNSPLRAGPDGTLYCLAFMGLLGDEWGWMPVATPAGKPLSPAAQRRGTHWPFQPVAGGLRLLGPEVYTAHEDTATHEVRYALVDRHDRVVRAWRILSRTDVYFHLTVPELAGRDPVVVLDFLGGGQTWEYEVLRLGPRGTRARLSLSEAVWGSHSLPDLRVGPDGDLYQLGTSPVTGVAVSRYSLSGS